ncbi:hypothetical protein KAFR_0B04530 [Kazachstania africana CBS 2517]|uniref:Transcription factor TFIIIC triple barrel domain-containing protein n=1 Tax=Kazachstania africana (strain ATCC 22294 / BCRC 22015 / CBS 2517 / CECT 1963 / NBRC 1671 / NRRL Y-8276) TaxID=1071382 RepID=H2AQV0_KAZAF|nr:hypothetical protein KAFR_0B04530 [Kazachstania africana CBS 2517]CCF56750.1 hypothetical protein KAFR_0B04530 [Kazachstania africana CBS 2517]
MTIETIYIARHGYRSNWLPYGPYPAPPTGIDSDVPLAEHGRDQAVELANFIKTLENKPEIIFTSPFYRCLETSEPIQEALNVPIYTDRGIGEWYKPDRDIIPVPATDKQLLKFFPWINVNWEDTLIPSDKGETEADVFDRCSEFLPKFIKRLESTFPKVSTILLVTHAATKAALGMNLLKFPNARVPIDGKGTVIRNASCSLDEYTRVNDDTWDIVMNGNTLFLKNGEEMNWSFMNLLEAGSDADIKARQLEEMERKKAAARTN